MRSSENHKQSMQNLGGYIRSLRQQRHLTQQQLANLSGLGINFVSQVERGKPTAHMGKVLQLLQTIGLELLVRRGSKGLIITGNHE